MTSSERRPYHTLRRVLWAGFAALAAVLAFADRSLRLIASVVLLIGSIASIAALELQSRAINKSEGHE